MPLHRIFFRAEDGIRAGRVTGVQTCALPISYTQGAGTLALTANNYQMTFSNPTPNNYVITQKAITVTAAANSKTYDRSEERRVGKGCSSRWASEHEKIKIKRR